MTILTALLKATLGAWLIAAVIGLLRLGFRRVLSPKAKYYLWVLLALRLMLPVLPESPLSLMNLLPQREAVTISETAPTPVSIQPVPAQTETENATLPAISAPLMEQSGSIERSAPVSEPVPETDHTKLVWQTIVLWIWLGGVGLVLLVYLVLYAITGHQLRRLPCVTDPDTLRVFLKLGRDLGIGGKVNLVSGGGGMLGGLLRPTVVIPAELQGQAVAPILVHELLHYKYKDLWVYLLFRVLTAIHWFNPVVWLCLHILRSDSEAACDQRVLESGLVERERYATVLYEEGMLQMKNSILMQTTFGGDGRSLKRRIRLIAQFRRPKVWMTVLTVALALAVSACTLTGAQRGDADTIRDALIGAEDTFFALGSYTSSTGDTSSLSEEELQSQIDAFNQSMRHYYAADCVYLHEGRGDEGSESDLSYNEYLLREVFSDPKNIDYIVGSGTLACDVEKLKEKDDTAVITAELARYSTRITLGDDEKYHIQCSFTLYHRTANMVLEDGFWKVLSFDNAQGEWWDSKHFLDREDVAYDTFVQALTAAQNIDVTAECPYLQSRWDWVWMPEPAEQATDSIVSGNPAKADQLPVGMDMDSYIDAIQPGFGHYGWTFQEHLDAGLLDADAGEWAYQGDYESGFMTEIELDGMRLEAEFTFSQTLFTWDTDAPQVLTEVLVTVPSDVVDGIQWGLDLMEPWADYMTIAGNDNAANYCATPVNVGSHLTSQQREIAAQMMVEIGKADGLENARDLLDNWAIVGGEYRGNQGVWQFNGTGAALYLTRPVDAEENTPSLEATISPYVLSGDGVTYNNTQWGMTTEQVFAAEKLDEEAWRYVSQSKSIMPREAPIPDHLEVTDLVYYFNYTGPELEFGLNLVITRYDAQTVGFDQLVKQRTQELGAPGFQDETKASWEFPDGTALLLINDEDILDERLTASMSQFADGTLQNLDVEAYMEDLQAPNGHFGWTFDQHVDAGLLNPNDGTQESHLGEDGNESLYFHTTTELGGYEVPITYLFHKTLVSEDPVLTQVFVTPPEGVVYRDWVEAFWDPWKDKLYEQSSLRFTSPVMLSSLLPQETQAALIDQINEQTGRTDATLTNWSLMCCWYEASANFWQFNGTGAALYLTATEAE